MLLWRRFSGWLLLSCRDQFVSVDRFRSVQSFRKLPKYFFYRRLCLCQDVRGPRIGKTLDCRFNLVGYVYRHFHQGFGRRHNLSIAREPIPGKILRMPCLFRSILSNPSLCP